MGVAAYIPKPIDTARLLEAIRQAAIPLLQLQEIKRLKFNSLHACGLFNGTNPVVKKIIDQILNAADSDYSVVVTGEKGTGKSSVAEMLHTMSDRKSRPLLTIDCRSRSSEQLDGELFGRMTGRGRPTSVRDCGTLHEITGGTLVLDAPEMLNFQIQERFLSLLEKGAYRPNGSTELLQCNVRAVVVTSVDLEKESIAGRFNHNLWLRLSDMVLNIPPLRERAEDIPAFCSSFLLQAADDLGRACPTLTSDALDLLQKDQWPGNFRQLKQIIRRIVFHSDSQITVEELKPLLKKSPAETVMVPDDLPSLRLTDLEQWAVQKALKVTGGKKMQAAELLGISYNSFKDKLRRSGM